MKQANFQSIFKLTESISKEKTVNEEYLLPTTIEYPKNFSSDEKIVENISHLKHKYDTGYTRWFIFNGIRVEHRNFNLVTPLDADILSTNFPYFKMHFSLEGEYCYTSKNTGSLDIHILKGNHNLFFFPNVKDGHVHYESKNEKSQSFEITLSFSFIYRVFKNSWEVLDVLGDAIKNNTPIVFSDKQHVIPNEIHTVIQQIINCNIREELKKPYLEAKIIELLILQIDNLKKDEKQLTSNVKNFNQIQAAKAFIEANIDSNLTIPFIARNVGLNINYLKSEFKELYNVTIFQYLTSLRMQHANHLINHTDTSITEIADKVSYKHPQHFTKVFKKHFGKTPSELRKERQE